MEKAVAPPPPYDLAPVSPTGAANQRPGPYVFGALGAKPMDSSGMRNALSVRRFRAGERGGSGSPEGCIELAGGANHRNLQKQNSPRRGGGPAFTEAQKRLNALAKQPSGLPELPVYRCTEHVEPARQHSFVGARPVAILNTYRYRAYKPWPPQTRPVAERRPPQAPKSLC